MMETEETRAQVDLDGVTARAEHERQRIRLHRNLKFLKMTDDLGTAIAHILETWLEVSVAEEGNVLTSEDVEDTV